MSQWFACGLVWQHALQALTTYMAELSKWGAADRKDDAMIAKLQELCSLSQCTAFESQLCRSLRKDAALVQEAVVRYCGIYAAVPGSSVLPQLWDAAQEHLAKAK